MKAKTIKANDKQAFPRKGKGDSLMEMKYLPNRKAIIECGTQLVKDAQQQWIGMGRTAAWIKLPEFRQAVKDASERGVALKVVVFYEGDVEKHTKDWCSFGATVAFFEHGYIRILISDYNQAMVAFPKVVTSLYEDREYFGFHIQDETSVSELLNYFNQIWEDSKELGTQVDKNTISKQNWAKYEGFASGVLRFLLRVIVRAYPDWLEHLSRSGR